ncbi:putative Zn peptidase [Candidatus Terasakiella magnetica]|uniref:Putative Zn peptidase n=1 Tax=Candidatus Terasakiella magnetica TaxID=1867952 RepID=A0A1C3RHR0_9PROT|nr:XRE family transcriptional regulator [Candidatus Terasakiella magnetica]SCA56744.1 putative Zn peptidase [Candidatus Terasakiella magnetica]
MQLNQIDPITLGDRLRVARESKQITQAVASEAINAARTTLVAIEKGQRKLKISELKKLADLYNCSVNSLLREEAIHVDLVPRFRKQMSSHANAGEKAASTMTQLAKAEVELENLLGVQRVKNYPPERPLLPGNVERQAEQDALELRQWLGLSQSPIHDIVSILEFDLGVRLYIKKMDSSISGLFAYEDALGACILLNGNHPRDRRNLTAAHELGHLVSTRRVPEVLFDDDPQTSKEEKYANAFAKAFLMPSRALINKFKEITSGATQFTRRHVIILSHTFCVSREATVRQLEDLQVIKKGTWDWFTMNGGISNEQALEVLGELAINNRDQGVSEKPTTYRLNSLICQAWQQELLSEGQLVKLLDIDHHELRDILDNHDLDGSDADDAPSLFD